VYCLCCSDLKVGKFLMGMLEEGREWDGVNFFQLLKDTMKEMAYIA